MTKMEIIAIRGILKGFELERHEPKPEWMSEQEHQGRKNAYGSAVAAIRDFIEAAEDE